MNPTVTLTIPRLPNYDAVGANARHRNHWKARWVAEVTERTRWIEELVVLGFRSREQPLILGLVKVRATLIFPSKKMPDKIDNLISGLKPLFDVLEPWRIINVKGQTRGWCGVYENDRNLSWMEPPIVQIDPDLAPLIALEFYDDPKQRKTLKHAECVDIPI